MRDILWMEFFPPIRIFLSSDSTRRFGPLALAIAASLALSLLSTWVVNSFLAQRVSILGSFAGFERAYNPGVAFSITFPPIIQGILVTLALGAVLYLAFRSQYSLLSSIAYGMIIGGALGNVIDRLPDGFVTDFIQVGTFPIFNVADSCINIGIALLLLDLVLKKRTEAPR